MKKLLLGLIGLLFAIPVFASNNLPSEYTELQYIESTGTQCIVTGVVVNRNNAKDFTIDSEMLITSTSGYRLCGAGGAQQQFYFGLNGSSKFAYGSGDMDSSVAISGQLDTWYNYYYSPKDGIYTVKNDGGNVVANTSFAFSDNFVGGYPISLFGYSTSVVGNCVAMWAGKIKKFYVYKNDNLFAAFVPVRRESDGALGMYDTVSGQFFTNAGTGEFIAGPEVSIRIATTAYNSARFSPVVTELNDTIATIRSVVTNTINQTKAIADLQATKQTRPNENCPAGKKCLLVEDNDGTPHWYEIIENAYGLPSGYTGLQYIDMTTGSYLLTDIVPTYDGRVEMDFQTTTLPSGSVYFVGGRTQTYGGLFLVNSLNNFIVDAFGTTADDRYTSSISPANNTRYKFIYDNQVATLTSGGTTLFTNTMTGTTVNGASLVINGLNNNGTISGGQAGIYLYSFKVWNAQGELVMNLIPAENSSGVVGMYDTVSGIFKTATAGTFTAGPEI